MVVLKDKLSKRPVFYFWGSNENWDKLIYGNLKDTFQVFLWDVSASLNQYPPQVKLIRSQLTAKRFFGFKLDSAVIFVNAIPLPDISKVVNCDWHGGLYFIVRLNRRDLMDIIEDKRVDLYCRKRMKYIRLFK